MRLIVFILFFFVSCNPVLQERHYKSIGEATGGLYYFSLDLNSDKKLVLKLKVYTQVKQSEAGEEWESISKDVIGKWDIKDKNVIYTFDKLKSSIDSIFINTEFGNIDKPILSFSQKLDTAFVYGIPCLINE
jgi:hypothetical protein